MVITAAILLVLSCLLWLGLAFNALSIHRSDPAGRGLAVAYGAANACLLLLAMGGLFVACAVARRAPPWLLLSSVLLVPGVCAASLGTLALLGRYTRMRWVAASPVLGPGLLIGLAALCLWWRAAAPEFRATDLGVVGVVALCCLVPWLAWWVAPRVERPRGRGPAGERRGTATVEEEGV